jgi:hypothetical protein
VQNKRIVCREKECRIGGRPKQKYKYEKQIQL